MRSPLLVDTRAPARITPSVFAFFAVLTALALGAGCSRSTLQGELGEIGQSCANQACPAGTTCNPATLMCVVEDGGTKTTPDSGTNDGCTPISNEDPSNCGGCGVVCKDGMTCFGGKCLPDDTPCANPTCTNFESCCQDVCTDTTSNPNNCGGCNIICPQGWSCVASACQEPAQSCATSGCVFGQTCCGAACIDPTTDPNNCGGCGLACNTSAGQSCVQGQCCTATPDGTACSNPTCNCAVGETCCGAEGCVMTSRDPDNCGKCGNVCPGSSCVSGVCAGTCNGAMCGTGESCCASGCATVLTDPNNCGGCGVVCDQGQSCVAGKCVTACAGDGPTCAIGQQCCTNGCTSVQTDPLNCGGCNIQCGATAQCIDGTCAANEGPFNPTVNPTYLSPGVHNFTTINVPAGVTVYVAGAGPASGTLDLHATGAIEIDGTIDVSGGPGTQNTITSQSTQSGRAGGGGFTGEPYATADLSAACQFVAGNSGQLGFPVSGSTGTCTLGSTTVCGTIDDPASEVFAAPPAEYGGGAGVFTGFRAYGSGGGGPAGGAAGSAGTAYAGEPDCSGVTAGGGATNGAGGTGGAGAPYDGIAGVLGQTQCTGMGVPAAYVGGGGGGSIGPSAVADLAVTTTFQTGSGGGGASADYLDRPVFGGTSGGGGGGGALRLETPATITVTGQLYAKGGAGGDAVIGTPAPNCDPQPGAGGGGGSGGVIYLMAPSISVTSAATISAEGGAGGQESEFASGGAGGTGGLGRIRLSVTPTSCALAGQFTPPLAAGCSAANQLGSAYVAAYPN